MSMTVTNLTDQDYWFGPLHLPAGNGSTLTVDDTSETSLYLTSDAVADALNNLYLAGGKITVSGAAQPFPRPTGVPEILHGDGSPEGTVFAGQGSLFLRRDNTGSANGVYTKTTGASFSTGWQVLGAAGSGPIQGGLNQDTATATADGGSGNSNDSLDAPAYLVLNHIIKT